MSILRSYLRWPLQDLKELHEAIENNDIEKG